MEILLLEDHLPTAQSISWTLQSKYQVIHVSSCRAAEQQLRQHHFDAMIVDLNLPDGSGLDFCQSADLDDFCRSQSNSSYDSPKIIVLTGQNEVRMKVRALEAGADDYLTKPFSPLELQARVGAVLRREERSKRPSESFEKLGSYRFSLSNRILVHHGQTIHFTRAEANLFAKLLHFRDRIVRKEAFLEDRYGELGSVTLNSVETHLKTLRQKLHLQKQDRFIETIYGMGYRLNSSYAK